MKNKATIYWREGKKNTPSTLLNGRNSTNMSDFKYYEYHDLFYYVKYGWRPRFGYCLVIHRFYKNLKRRKKMIKMMEEMIERK